MKWLIYLVHVAICKEVEIDTLRNTERILFNLKRINRAELKPKFTEHKKKYSQWLFFDAIFAVFSSRLARAIYTFLDVYVSCFASQLVCSVLRCCVFN